MIRAFIKTSDNAIKQVSDTDIAGLNPHTQNFVWIDIESENLTPTIEALLIGFNCHPLAIKDAFRKRHPPKFEDFEDHSFILFRGIHQVEDVLTYSHQPIALFASTTYLITIHPSPSMGIEKTLADGIIEKASCNGLNTALYIMHQSSGFYLQQALLFEDELSEREDNLYSRSGEKSLAELSAFRAKLIKLRRIFDYHCNISREMKKLGCRAKYLNFEDSEHLINDLDDRFDRLYTLTKLHYDICGEIIDGYISITSHQLNITMRVLTVITATFVPLSFLAGIYGMNFDHMPELHFKHAYFLLLGTMSIIAVGLLAIFKYKKWF